MGMNCRNPVCIFFSSVLFVSYSLVSESHAATTITQGQVIRDGETVVSAGETFVLGFFSPGNSTSRYVGIWYYRTSLDAVVWVANRANPISGRNGVLTVGSNGNLVVLDGSGNSVWSTNVSLVTENSTAILMDSGNLVLFRSKDVGDTRKAYWQSFQLPTDTYLQGMKVPTENGRLLFYSWKTANEPSPGNYSMGIDTRASPQVVIWEKSNRWWRSGHWNGLIFVGIPNMRAVYLYGFKLVINEGSGDMYFTYNSPNSSDALMRFWLRWDGRVEQLKWDNVAKEWSRIQLFPSDDCGMYNRCGNFGRCSVMGSAQCSCIDGYEPTDTDQWNKGNWSGGCVRRTQLQCLRNGSSVNEARQDGFLEMEKAKLPDFADRVDVQDRKACEGECLKNCSCNAYAYVSGIGCMLWRGYLIDIEVFADGGETLYIRLDDSELGNTRKISKGIIIAIAASVAIFTSVLIWLLWLYRANFIVFSNSSKKNTFILGINASRSREFSEEMSGPADVLGEGKQGSGQELPLYNFTSVAIATNYFSFANRLGQGGFGPVYKGKLPGGEEIAVKRLSKMSGQGVEEFKNEIILIAKLQHRNLVRLLGCCIEGEEKMLIYEYMPNKSLDSFLFDQAKQAQLDWRKRTIIIEGIARGLLYLHRDSRLRIIHRDLKASNILLDEEMNPKISDFGMARIFGGNQNEANTNRVVGTYGYMSPEYAMEGLFSVKSDVYSFGILLLEIVSGRRNNSFRSHDSSGLVEYVWQLWNEGRAMEFMDASLGGSCSQSEFIRCMHVGLLCVQDSPASRPTMSSVLLMLGSEAVNLPIPRQPTFPSMRSSMDVESLVEVRDAVSSNDVTMTAILGR